MRRFMRKSILAVAALASVFATGAVAPTPAAAAPVSQAVLAAVHALPDSVETVQYGAYERERRFRARQAARRREFRRRQAARRAARGYRY